MDTFVARQPVFDRRREVYGYELLFRSSLDQVSFPGGDAAAATKQVVSNALFSIGMDRLLCGKRAFVNFDYSLLQDGLYNTFAKSDLVIEVLETVKVDEAVIATCAELHQSGFTIALDDFEPGSEAAALLPFAKIVKVDMRLTSRADQEELLRRDSSKGISFLAEKVETYEEFEWARQLGYELFQGHFFKRPEVLSGRDIPSVKLACLQLLSEVSAPEIDFRKTAAIIKRDVGLSYKILRYVNSAAFAVRQTVSSIDHSVVLLGASGLRQWAAIAGMPELASNKPTELTIQSLVRAQFCNHLTNLAGGREADMAFLIGLFSHLDAMLDMPLDEALKHVGLGPLLQNILLDRETRDAGNPLKAAYELARSYEVGAWDAVMDGAAQLKINPDEIGRAYTESTSWAEQAMKAAAPNAKSQPARHSTAARTLVH